MPDEGRSTTPEPDGFCDRCQQKVWTRSDGMTLMGHPCDEGRVAACAGCGNDLAGDNLCMVSACQWEPPSRASAPERTCGTCVCGTAARDCVERGVPCCDRCVLSPPARVVTP